MTFIGKRVHHDWRARSAPDTADDDGLLGTLEAAGVWFSFPTSSTLDDVK
jgi:hypothetical protein